MVKIIQIISDQHHLRSTPHHRTAHNTVISHHEFQSHPPPYDNRSTPLHIARASTTPSTPHHIAHCTQTQHCTTIAYSTTIAHHNHVAQHISTTIALTKPTHHHHHLTIVPQPNSQSPHHSKIEKEKKKKKNEFMSCVEGKPSLLHRDESS